MIRSPDSTELNWSVEWPQRDLGRCGHSEKNPARRKSPVFCQSCRASGLTAENWRFLSSWVELSQVRRDVIAALLSLYTTLSHLEATAKHIIDRDSATHYMSYLRRVTVTVSCKYRLLTHFSLDCSDVVLGSWSWSCTVVLFTCDWSKFWRSKR